MSRFEELPIYKKSFELLLYIENAARSFPRYHKYTIGSEIRSGIYDLTTKISSLNSVPNDEKANFFKQLDKQLDKCKIQLALCRELRVFKNFKVWYHAAEMLHDIIGQSEKLKKYFEKNGQNQRSDSL